MAPPTITRWPQNVAFMNLDHLLALVVGVVDHHCSHCHHCYFLALHHYHFHLFLALECSLAYLWAKGEYKPLV